MKVHHKKQFGVS